MTRAARPPGVASSPAVVAFATAFSGLFVQVLVHRMISAKLINNFAFLVISLTMLGFAGSGVLLTRWHKEVRDELDDVVLGAALLFGPLLLLATILLYQAPFRGGWGLSRAGFVAAFAPCLPLALLYALPFACCGVILGALLSHPGLSTRRVYCFDLVGSACGAFAAVPALSWLGAERAALACPLALLAGVGFVAVPRRRWLRPAALASGALLATAWLPTGLLAMRHPAGTILGTAQAGVPGYAVEYTAWDPVARIEVSRIPTPGPDTVPWPFLIGTDAGFHRRFRRILTQNNNAFTYAVDFDGNPASLRGIESTLYAAAYPASPVSAPRVLVVGVGGGFDVLTALHYDASRVTGVEVNAATVDILRRVYKDYFRSWVDDPRVRIVHDEGRHWLARSSERYDVIQLSGVDSASGTPGAAHVFSESYLYTSEAFDLYLARLTEDGVMNLMRAEWVPPREMLRALTTGVAALRRAGAARPADHVVMVSATSGLFSALLVKKRPFTSEERRSVASWAEGQASFEVSAAPELNGRRANVYQVFLSLDDPAKEASFLRQYPFDVRPVDDDRPFFFKYSRWGHLLSRDPVVMASVPYTELSLILLLATTGLATIACVYVPLRVLAAEGRNAAAAGRYAAFFAGTGLGYMAIEIALVQELGLVLGHPNLAVSVVIAGLLFWTGVGAMASQRIMAVLGGPRFVAYALAGMLLLEQQVLIPWLRGRIGGPFAGRVALVLAHLLPLGVLLGSFFPWALERLKAGSSEFAPWAWGINGIFSVLGPILSVAISTTWGMGALMLASIPVYLFAAWCLPDAAP